MHNRNLRILFLISGLLLLCNPGCKNSSISEVEDLETVSLYSKTNQLAQTLEYVRSLDRYEMRNFRDKVNSGLNRWVTGLDGALAEDWTLEELTSGLPEAIRDSTVFANLDDASFFSNDANYVQQIYWLNKIATRITENNFVFHHEYIYQIARKLADEATLESWKESDNLLMEALKLIHPELSAGEDGSEIEKLTQAIKLFDWSIRNVHLQEIRPWPTEELVKKEAFDINAEPGAFPPATGTGGPGYIHFPWQTLTYGKGDYLERANVYVGLCNQMGIPAAVLALPGEEESSRPFQEWLCGAVIGDQIFLFDPLLGLPIHGKREGSIATLAEVKANPELLSNLNLTVEESVEKMDYRVTADQLDDLTALIVAPPEALSKRMTGLEDALTGEYRLKLTVDVSALAESFSEMDGIKDVQLWHVPFSCAMFREQASIAEAGSFDQEVRKRISWLLVEERYIDMFVQFRTARNCFLQGVFQSDKDRDIRSALSYYYSFMYDDAEIQNIDVNRQKRQSIGIYRDVNQSFAQWNNQLREMKAYMKIVRADAAFFLSLCNYENNMPFTTIKWLTRVRNYDDDRRWLEFIPYHLGRAHESTGNYEAAAKAYGRDVSSQKHGSLIRKRLMGSLDGNNSSDP